MSGWLAHPSLAKIPKRIETARRDHIIQTPLPGYPHGGRQFEIGYFHCKLLGGKVRAECLLSSCDGVKAVDVVWLSDLRESTALRGPMLAEAPEICVDVLSNSNTPAEMEKKKSLCFDAGADEVWFCDVHGNMRFNAPQALLDSPAFPVDLPA